MDNIIYVTLENPSFFYQLKQNAVLQKHSSITSRDILQSTWRSDLRYPCFPAGWSHSGMEKYTALVSHLPQMQSSSGTDTTRERQLQPSKSHHGLRNTRVCPHNSTSDSCPDIKQWAGNWIPIFTCFSISVGSVLISATLSHYEYSPPLLLW